MRKPIYLSLLVAFLLLISPIQAAQPMGDDMPISPGIMTQGWGEWHSVKTDPATAKKEGELESEVCFGAVILGVGATIMAAGFRIMLYVGEQTVRAYFNVQFKRYSHAYLIGDETGIGHGRYKFNYPKLVVGEVEFNVRGSQIEGGQVLKLKDGSRIEFYDGDGILREEAKADALERQQEKIRIAAAHPEDLRLQPSIFDKDEDEHV